MAIRLNFAADSHVGMIRRGNEDSGYADSHLLVIADGMGGAAFGEVASTTALRIVVDALSTASNDDSDGMDPSPLMREAIARAGDELRAMIEAQPDLEGMGTTMTMLMQVGNQVGIAQVGDSRGYLLRDGVLEQVTHDQTFVQSLIDQGRISRSEAQTHPQRAMILQALDGRIEVEPDIIRRTPSNGDRYLLCSDGLSGVVSEATLRDVLSVGSPADAVRDLIGLALRGGAPDNVTCIVADVVDDDGGPEDGDPLVVGAAAENVTSSEKSAAPNETPVAADAEDRPVRARRLRALAPVVLLILALLGAAGYGGYRWTQAQFYVATAGNDIAIYQGVPLRVLGHSLSTVIERSGIDPATLPDFARGRLDATIATDSLEHAQTVIATLRAESAACAAVPIPAGCPGATS